MEELSDTTHSPKKAKKSFSATDRVSPVKSESPNKNALFNGTEHNKADDKAKENHNNSKVIKITKVSKTKTEQSSPGHCKSPKEESAVASSPQCDSPTTSAEECFLGFENVLLSDKQDILLKLLQKLGGSTENVNSSQLSPKKESETREEMTIADSHQSSDSESDHDSNQMEIDMGNDKETLSKADSTDFNDKNCLSGNFTKGVDVDMETDSVKSDSEKTSKNTDDKTLISNSSKLDTFAKGGQPKLEYCGSCSAVVDDAEEGICCDGNCERWFHLRCSGLSQAEYDELSGDENAKWACEKCSGKPPSIKADGKPLLSVRKDLGKISAPSPIAKRRSLNKDGSPRTPRIDISNPAFLKPFDFGWKRELVYRSTIDSMNRRQGDVYYYSPKGKKLRSLREISEHCGADLTQDNFTFWKEPLGIDDPNKEIIREAKIKLGSKEPGPSPVLPKKVVTKITKTPKSLPKLTATVSPMESTAPTPAPAPAQVTPKASASVTPRVVFKGKTSLGPKFKITPSKNNVPGQAPKIVINKGVKKTRSSRNTPNREVKSTHRRYEEVIADPRISIPNNKSENEDMGRRNKFRRYGLLANAKTPRKIIEKFNPYTSSSSDDDTNTSCGDEGLNKKTILTGTRNKPMTDDKIPTHIERDPAVDLEQPSYCNSNENSIFLIEDRIDDNILQQFSKSNSAVNTNSSNPMSHTKSLTLGPSRKRPSPPEIQFRPSNPSSYGCQTSPVLSCRSTGLNLSNSSSSFYSSRNLMSSSQIETVLIVDSPRDTFRKAQKTVESSIPFDSPLILSNNGSIEIINVESLNSEKEEDRPPESYSIGASFSSRSVDVNKGSRKLHKTNRHKLNSRKTIEHSPVSITSSSSVEVVVDDEPDSSNPPPFLDRNSPAHRLTRHDSTASRSPPSLLPITTGTGAGSVNQTGQDLQSSIYLDSSMSDTGTQYPSSSHGSRENLKFTGKNKKVSSTDEELEIGMLPPTWDSLPKPKEPKLSGGSASARMEVCSIRCLPAMGLIPTLQCHVCLCLYHPECVGLAEANNRTIHSYKCKNCQGEKPKAAAVSPKATLPPPPLTPISTLSSSPTGVSHLSAGPPKLQRMMDGKPVGGPRARVPQPKTSSIVGGVTTWLPPSSTIQLRAPPLATSKFSPSQKPLPPTTTTMVDTTNSQPVQTLVSMDCKRFIIVPKHNVLSVSPATTSSAQVAEPVSTHVTTTASEQTVSVSSLPSQTFGPGGPGMPKSVPTSTAFIVSSSSSTTNTFQSPPGVLLVPYITPQVQPTQSEGQQQQYIVVNGPSGLQTGNFIIGNIPQQQQLKLPTVPTSQPAEPLLESAGVKRPVDSSHESSPPAKRAKTDNIPPPPSPVMQNVCYTYGALLHAFQYLKVQELLRASRVCHMWRDIALHKCLWETVRMKNSHVKDWEGFASTLRRVGARHLDLRKILVPDKPEAVRAMWADCVKALSKVNSLVKLDLCRCTSGLLEQIANVCPQLEYIAAGTLKSNQLNMTTLGACQNLTELKLKGQGGIELCNVSVLGKLIKLKHLSLTTMKNTANVMEVIGEMTQLESLELGDFLNVSESSIASFSQLTRLKRLRLEKGQADCPTDTILRTISQINSLVQLELINFDVKAGFEESLALCFNIRRLLIIPTYVTQSATTNHLVIEGVSKLASTLQHFVWGLTLELLRVTDLFIDQWEMNQKSQGAKSPNQAQQKKSASGDSIPILKPATKNQDGKSEGAVTQVDVLQLPKLHKVLTTLLPSTKIIILKVPFSATSRQTITGSPQ